ncbi:NAD-dependent epimerase/dehydratase family protein [Martelella alba]|uniref:NAD-dependent epimerase/dehydratase family protein n=1 Tax=Martelella alba TaxID=2590451 RepID=A0A506UGZ7_9HYPH|nr:NAD-dependent epimerase/dehydratase family protein [Martelella alba]TPW31757.1 NAD-dependent epimerase/dehydratase family protein [Martelella alba]
MTETKGRERPVALVLGAGGGIGGAVAKVLAARGFKVRALSRRAAEMRVARPEYDWVSGDAMNGADVRRAAEDATLIFHGVNPPGYQNWETLAVPMLDNTIAAARASGALILFPGTVYNFGREQLPEPAEDAVQTATTKKGRIRITMENRLRDAAAAGTQVIIVRAGDYFGPEVANSWFSYLVKSGRPVRSVTRIGRKGVGHQWAYLPDVAETMMQLVERRSELQAFSVFHFEGTWDADGERMIETIGRVAGRDNLAVKSFPWWMVPFAAPFVTVMREVQEVSYLWREPLHMRNDRLVAVLGAEPRTPLETAIRATLIGQGCLPGPDGLPFTAPARTA